MYKFYQFESNYSYRESWTDLKPLNHIEYLVLNKYVIHTYISTCTSRLAKKNSYHIVKYENFIIWLNKSYKIPKSCPNNCISFCQYRFFVM